MTVISQLSQEWEISATSKRFRPWYVLTLDSFELYCILNRHFFSCLLFSFVP